MLLLIVNSFVSKHRIPIAILKTLPIMISIIIIIIIIILLMKKNNNNNSH